MATAKDPRDERLDPFTTDAPTDPPDMVVVPGAVGADDDLSMCVGTDLLGLVVQERADGVRVLAVDGELDALTAPLLGVCLREQFAANPAHLILDLQAVRFLGSSGLNCLLDARESVQQIPGMQLHIAGVVTRAVARPLEVTGLMDRFITYPTLEDALTALAE
ncbi:MAG: STAS domain-containing protein [Actinomycetota bacterium]|nr:STAS domain-containing protein [Actinomycetota bacterium]